MDFDQIRAIASDAVVTVTFFGGLGGAVRAAVLRTTWAEAARVVFVGAATSCGVGVLGLAVLRPVLGLPDDIGFSPGTRSSAAFLIGLIAVSYVERLIDRHKVEKEKSP